MPDEERGPAEPDFPRARTRILCGHCPPRDRSSRGSQAGPRETPPPRSSSEPSPWSVYVPIRRQFRGHVLRRKISGGPTDEGDQTRRTLFPALHHRTCHRQAT